MFDAIVFQTVDALDHSFDPLRREQELSHREKRQHLNAMDVFQVRSEPGAVVYFAVPDDADCGV